MTTDGFIANYMNRQIIVMAALAGIAFSLYMIPHCPTQMVFFVVGAVFGLASGLYDAAQVVWIIEIWQEKAGPFILSQHLFYAIGANIPSLVIAPFLDEHDTLITERSSRIYIPFTILGAISTSALLFQLLLFIFCRYYKPPMYVSKNNDDVSTRTDVNATDAKIFGINVNKLKLIAVTSVFLGAHQGMEACTQQFIPIFGQYSDLKLTESASAYVLTSLTAAYAVGRAIGVIIIFKVRPEIIICINFVLIFVANCILLIWASNNLTMFWIGCIMIGAGFSTMFPTFCAFMEKYLVFTNAVGSIVCVVASVFASTYPLIVGHLIKERAVVLTYTNFFSTVVCILAMISGYLLVRRIKVRV
ncbi:sodium-dependent glucose transporter 1-like isoform X2 [Bradysia coprophila]|uniref:sodium-dependent glucose transporter 1-like isoform X2 n=1 Tax=Bradysia coprophila TaxID=38358 RepID=UPI00187DD309|nr:sodium-dependent glucose transporter 1-like isoform X2 [Bradysia coprophila]